ncbi:MAG: superoxide dismutase family protein [Gammaproteobacteria bacterium]
MMKFANLKRVNHVKILVLLSSAVALASCGDDIAQERGQSETQNVAVATLTATSNSNAVGEVEFTSQGSDVVVTISATGLSTGVHAVHIHENGDCNAADASSAGGHFAPEGHDHGAPSDGPQQRHVGDLGNVLRSEQGVAKSRHADSVIALDGPNSIVGKAIVIHAESDDFVTQPGGDAGPRVACGVIEYEAADSEIAQL